jgi:hypothetical protein
MRDRLDHRRGRRIAPEFAQSRAGSFPDFAVRIQKPGDDAGHRPRVSELLQQADR